MSDAISSHSTRDRGKLARFKRAGGALRTEEVAGDEPVSGPQIQWATHAEFPTTVRLLEFNCCAIPLTAAGGGGVFAAPAKAVASLDFGRPSRRSPADGGGPSASHSTEGCHVHRRWSDLPHGTRDTAESTNAVYCRLPGPRKKNARVLVSEWRKRGVRKRQQSVHRKCQAGLQATVLSYIEDFAGRLATPRSQWSCSHPYLLRFRPCDALDSRRFAQDKRHGGAN